MWLTLLHRGKLRMTKPNVVFFGYDFSPKTTAKIFLRTLLFSTSTRGNVIESMFVKLSHADKTETFSFWGYGETNNLVPGSGLFVDKNGYAANHHFVLSIEKPPYVFEAGEYSLAVFAKIIGKQDIQRLSTIDLTLTSDHARALATQDGVLFEFMPDTQTYNGHLNKRNRR